MSQYPIPAIASPCTGICKLDAATGWCLGCGRTGHEMDGWRDRSDAFRQKVWDKIPYRLKKLGVACRRLDWTTEDIRDFQGDLHKYFRSSRKLHGKRLIDTVNTY